MTNKGPRRAASDGEWSGRLTQARKFHEAARSLVTLAGSKSYNGAMTLMIAAAIGYADAITAKLGGVANKQDHQAASPLLREVLGNSLPDKHEKYFRRPLGRKDEVNYGARSTTHPEAERLLAELDEFATWAEGVL